MVAEIDSPAGPGIYLVHVRVGRIVLYSTVRVEALRGLVGRIPSERPRRLKPLIAVVIAVSRNGKRSLAANLRRMKEIKVAHA